MRCDCIGTGRRRLNVDVDVSTSFTVRASCCTRVSCCSVLVVALGGKLTWRTRTGLPGDTDSENHCVRGGKYAVPLGRLQRKSRA